MHACMHEEETCKLYIVAVDKNTSTRSPADTHRLIIFTMYATRVNPIFSLVVTSLCVTRSQHASFNISYPAVVLRPGVNGNIHVCPTEDVVEATNTQIRQDIRDLINARFETCGGIGWRRFAYLDMTDSTMQCPPGLTETSYSKRTCGIRSSGRCDSTTFPNSGGEYSRVCGRIIGYQYGEPEAFRLGGDDIESLYTDGVSVTHGAAGSRVHIWTFVAGMGTNFSTGQERLCPCDATVVINTVPSFLGDEYFCNSGNHEPNVFRQNVLYPDDPLWDGVGCEPHSTCCTFNNPPFFYKQLPNPTTDDIEVRLCASQRFIDDIPIELIELYVK